LLASSFFASRGSSAIEACAKRACFRFVLDKETVRRLDRIASGKNGGNGHRSVVGKQSRFDRLQPGSMLVREWDGARQRVVVLDSGFAWNGKTYRSLSAVAFAMNGTRWSGPRFFGLRGRTEGQS
jgi:hypothetical protein